MIKGVMLEDEKVPVSQLQPMPRGKAGRTSRCSRPLKSAAAELNRLDRYD
jgi:hypothetical protein